MHIIKIIVYLPHVVQHSLLWLSLEQDWSFMFYIYITANKNSKISVMTEYSHTLTELQK